MPPREQLAGRLRECGNHFHGGNYNVAAGHFTVALDQLPRGEPGRPVTPMHMTLHLNHVVCCVKLLSPEQTDSVSLDHCQHGESPPLRSSLSLSRGRAPPLAAPACSALRLAFIAR